jgi:S-adenosylmethionine hydrolase
MGTKPSRARRHPLTLALLTDFGLADPYVGQMKGVLASRAPGVPVVDLSHGVPPQDIRCGRFFLRASLPFFPDGTLFVCVVDPGVGTSRRILWARSDRHSFLAPDNGLLEGLPLCECREVANEKLSLPVVSSTFHGRDVFAPAAAALAGGLAPAKLGPAHPLPQGKDEEPAIVFIDRFGNAVTDLPAEKAMGRTSVRLEGKSYGPLRRTYSDVGEGRPLALVGSFGTVEFAVRGGSFAESFGARPGQKVTAGND